MTDFGVSSSPPDLPPPDPAAAAHGERVAAHLQRLAGAAGRLSFARYMDAALYAPGLGYYAGGAAKLGTGGDFTTAPEMTPLFGQVLSRPLAAALRDLGGGDVLEVGAGSGALMAALLPALAGAGAPLASYRILEVSPDLRERQQRRLAALPPGLAGRVTWEDALPAGFQGVVVANEVVDALPVHRVRIDASGDGEWYVVATPDGFGWKLGPPETPAVTARIAAVRELLGDRLEPPYDTEVALEGPAWVEAVAGSLAAGLVLIIDYGYPRREYYHPARRQGTLACHYRHRRHQDPLVLPGLQDLTAHVDFSALAEAAVRGGLHVAGFTTQAQFLLAQGLTDLLPAAPPTGDPAWVRTSRAVKQLLMPGEMGETVKVLALTRGLDAPGGVLGGRDLRGRL